MLATGRVPLRQLPPKNDVGTSGVTRPKGQQQGRDGEKNLLSQRKRDGEFDAAVAAENKEEDK